MTTTYSTVQLAVIDDLFPTQKRPAVFSKIKDYSTARDLRNNGHYMYMRRLESSSQARVTVDGKELLMFGSNNYLGLTTHPKVVAAAIKASETYGVGAGSVRLLGGNTTLHEALEERLAQFKGCEAAIAYSSGYVSNVATLSTLLNKQTDTAVIDERIHASLVDGLRLAQIPFRIFRHNDMADLEQKLLATAGANRFIIVDGVYSMDGDLCPLPEIIKLAQRYDAGVFVDDAHASGVVGSRGRGTAEHFGLTGKVDIIGGTLSKGLGGIGGFVAGKRDVIDFLKHCARGFVFSAALPPATCAALIAAMDVIEEEPEWLIRLHENATLMRKGLQQLGFNTGKSVTPIIPVILGDAFATHEFAKRLHELGVYACPVVFPAVRRGTSRIRVSVMATHTTKDILNALHVFEKARAVLTPLIGAAA